MGPTPLHKIKVNIDGAFRDSTKPAAIGIICHDYRGNMQWAFVDKIKSISAFMTEALAMRRALMIIQDLGNKNVVIETDCQTLLHCLENDHPSLCEWQSRCILEDVLGLLRSDPDFSVQFIPCKGNKGADLLAALIDKGVCPIGWVEIPLPPLYSVLEDDRKDLRTPQGQRDPQSRSTMSVWSV
ncbi:hypothetical protein QN277_005615 [Acacia crassicarpa]|uniref:RNase H type-1 domain-containing protein n=1 Tax=Acacia crassicarpa TaxID=499986 RepID=A0AAE1M9Z7_9FABA|nr:hypothetical protein QN277_005615 [Acacia crassicarpa]